MNERQIKNFGATGYLTLLLQILGYKEVARAVTWDAVVLDVVCRMHAFNLEDIPRLERQINRK